LYDIVFCSSGLRVGLTFLGAPGSFRFKLITIEQKKEKRKKGKIFSLHASILDENLTKTFQKSIWDSLAQIAIPQSSPEWPTPQSGSGLSPKFPWTTLRP
jgi:hypothetical protein